jgi:hypothetical protein
MAMPCDVSTIEPLVCAPGNWHQGDERIREPLSLLGGGRTREPRHARRGLNGIDVRTALVFDQRDHPGDAIETERALDVLGPRVGSRCVNVGPFEMHEYCPRLVASRI